jgi:hypothetical protein
VGEGALSNGIFKELQPIFESLNEFRVRDCIPPREKVASVYIQLFAAEDSIDRVAGATIDCPESKRLNY